MRLKIIALTLPGEYFIVFPSWIFLVKCLSLKERISHISTSSSGPSITSQELIGRV